MASNAQVPQAATVFLVRGRWRWRWVGTARRSTRARLLVRTTPNKPRSISARVALKHRNGRGAQLSRSAGRSGLTAA
eukprot:363847-Chlamydomonas_euryale.AAC.5